MKTLIDHYTIDIKNSTLKSDQLDRKLHLKINSLYIEATTDQINMIKKQNILKFNVDQYLIDFENNGISTHPKNEFHFLGNGEGEILDIREFNSSLPGDEFQEVFIQLINGFADEN